MVTAELIYRAFEAVVTSHKAGVSFVHDTNKILDRETGLSFPAAGWKLPTSGLSRTAEVYFDTYTLSVLFVDQTATDRSAEDMLQAHARMEVIAKQCVVRFSDLYITNTTAFQGVDIDLELLSDPVFTPVYDDDETMLTGVVLSMTVKAEAVECIDTYFN